MRGGLAGLCAALLLSACGAPTEPQTADRRPRDRERGSATSVPAPPLKPKSERDALADLAEQAASRIPMPSREVAAFPGPVLGADMSWPQCPRGMGIPERRTLGAPMPLPTARYVVIGLTNGPAFTANPCLAEQVAWVRERRLMAAAYAVTSFPDDTTLAQYADAGPFDGDARRGALANVGYQQARFNVASMAGAGLESPVVWIDVEPVVDFEWSGSPLANAAVVQGVAQGYLDAGYRIGVYSTPLLWSDIVGDLALGVPEWRAAGQTSRAEAQSRCGDDSTIQGGEAVLGQWVEQDRDQNITCGRVHREMGRWFHQY